MRVHPRREKQTVRVVDSPAEVGLLCGAWGNHDCTGARADLSLLTRRVHRFTKEHCRCHKGYEEHANREYQGDMQGIIFTNLDFAQGAASDDKAGVWAFELCDDDGATHTGSGLPGNAILAMLPYVVKYAGWNGWDLTIQLS